MKRLALLFLVILLALAGCSAAATQSSPMEPSRGEMAEYEGAKPAGEEPAAAPQANAGGQDSDIGERMVIRNADLSIVVEDPTSAMSAISGMAETMGGFIVTSNLYKTSTGSGQEVPEGSITVRVPAEKLNEALAQIRALVKDPDKDIRTENVTGQDVTKEYTDLSSRLKNLEEAEKQLREIMASAVKTEDVLSVHQQLTQVREQIEVIKGQMQYYEEASRLSSISVRVQALASVQPLEVGGWKPVGVARDALQALIETMQFLGSAAIWLLIYALPVGLVIFLPLRLLWPLLRRAGKNRKTQTPAPPAVS